MGVLGKITEAEGMGEAYDSPTALSTWSATCSAHDKYSSNLIGNNRTKGSSAQDLFFPDAQLFLKSSIWRTFEYITTR